LHWKADPNHHFLDWTYSDLKAMTDGVEIATRRIPVLNTPALYFYLCCHGAKHAWFRLKWLADIQRVEAKLSPEDHLIVERLSKESGTERVVAAVETLIELIYQKSAAKDGILVRLPLKAIINERELDGGRPHRAYLRDIPQLCCSLIYKLSLKSRPSYWLSIFVRALCDERDVKSLGLSRRWLLLYIALGPFTTATRLLRRQLRSAELETGR
jgi:hypothetical protein